MIRALALLLTLLTGFSGLVYQVAWQKVLATLLGSNSEAVAAVLGIFLGGLAAGYGLFGLVSQRLADERRVLVAYGIVEAGIGLHALVFPWLFEGVRAISAAVDVSSDALAFGLDVGLTILLIGPATVAMGGTIPLLTQGLARGLEDATRFHSYVYAFNTAGACAGALAAAFVLIPWLGLSGCILAMGLVNLLAGVTFGWLGLLGRRSEPARGAEAPPELRRAGGFAPWALVALLSGFAMMTLQTAMNRIGGLALGASHFTFAMVVAIFVFSIAVGSFAVSLAPRIHRLALPVTQWLLVGLLLIELPLAQDAGYWAYALRTQFSRDPADFPAFQLALFSALVAVALVPLALSGALLPLLFDHLRNRVDDLGRTAGSLYGWNTVGSLLGALGGGYALFFWLDLEHAVWIALAALSLSAGVLTAKAAGAPGTASVLVGAAACAIFFQSGWSQERLSAGVFRLRERDEHFRPDPDTFFPAFFERRHLGGILFYDDDPTSSVAVIRFDRPGGESLSITVNGKSDGNVPDDDPTMGLAGLVPALFVDDPATAFVIGYGTGTTVAAIERLDSIRDVQVAEISPGVIAAASSFDAWNGGASEDPRTRILRSDAYRALLRTEQRFDVIVSEPSNPWVTGVEMLFSREFLEAARDRLGPDGVYAQWMQRYETDDASIALVLRTYLSVFPRVSVWLPLETDMILLGFKDPLAATDLAKLRDRFEQRDARAAFARFGIPSFGALLAHEAVPLGALHAEDLPGPVHTLMHPRLSDLAARAFFAGRVGALPIPITALARERGTQSSLLWRALDSAGDARASLQREVLHETCSFHPSACTTLSASWMREDATAVRAWLAPLRAKARGRTRQAVAPQTLSQVGLLFDAQAAALLPPTFETARRLESLFHEFHHYAAPFDYAVVERAWARCRSDARCAKR